MPEAMTILLFDESLQVENTWRCLSYFHTFNDFINVASFVRYDSPQKWISAKEKFTTASITEEEPFNHCIENMEVFFHKHIRWITKLS